MLIAASPRARQQERGTRPAHKEYVRAYLASAKGKAAMKPRATGKKSTESPKGAAMKRYQQSAKGRAVNRTAKKKYNESPKGRATLQALRERNKEHQKAYRESPRADGLRSRMGE